MNGKMKKLMATILLVSFVTAVLIFLNGCRKSEPQTSRTPVESQKEVAEHAAHEHAATTVRTEGEVASAVVEQTMCPVMEMKIDKNIFVEYKGKKVYFCCPACIEKFKAEPEKYIAKLPQFKQ